MTIYYLNNRPKYAAYLRRHLEGSGISLTVFTGQSWKDIGILLLFSPVWHYRHYISCDRTWKKFLADQAPKTILLSAGIREADHPNYLDLLNLPTDMAGFFSKARSAGEPWEPIDTGGLSMEGLLRQFYEGHGRESVQQIFNEINRIVGMARDEMKNFGTPYPEVRLDLISPNGVPEKWRALCHRWEKYLPFFSCLPFAGLFEEMDAIIHRLAPFFKTNCTEGNLLEELDVPGGVTRIHDLLKKGERYVY